MSFLVAVEDSAIAFGCEAAKFMQNRLVEKGSYVYYYKNELGHRQQWPKNLEERSKLPSDHYPVVTTIKL